MSSFTTKARTVELLGRKQIRDSVTAIAELMKNSYDADATTLRVEFNTMSQNPRVIIADTGVGMSKTDIETKWLVLGTNSKTHRRNRKTASGRPLMGAKGIGRLAAAAVGQQVWMFTKTEASLWNVVFIHWGLFENPKLAIHEINVPTRFGISTNELLLRFDEIICEMKSEILQNLNQKAWYTAEKSELNNSSENTMAEDEKSNEFISALANEIISDVDTTDLNKKHVEKFLAGYKNGTVLYIEKLHDDWDRYLAPISSDERKGDPMTEKMFNRFASFVSNLDSAESPNIPFSVEVYYNNKVWKTDFSYTEDDYNIYDVKVEGRIERGKFYGYLNACNADPVLLETCNQQLRKGLDVTSGISDWENKDCGAFSIKFCHLEGVFKSSGLSADDYNRIKQKLTVSCGISVYRDGVRILPYGEPENDFLSIEARRTQKAGRYVFSHRNIFGRIDIDSVNNPMLEDKSSREGLIENVQYHYFVKVLENLLVIIAVDYLSRERKSSLKIQDSYVAYNEAQAEQEKIKQAIARKEEIQLSKLKADAKKWLSAVPATLQKQCNAVMLFCNKNESACQNLNSKMSLDQLDQKLDTLAFESTQIQATTDLLLSQHFDIPQEYMSKVEEDLLVDVDKMNQHIQIEHDRLTQLISDSKGQYYSRIQVFRNEWMKSVIKLTLSTPDQIKSTLFDRVSSLTNEHRRLQSAIANESLQNRQAMLAELKHVEVFLTQLHGTSDLEATTEWLAVQEKIESLTDLRNTINKMFDQQPEAVAETYKSILVQIDEINIALLNAIMRLRHKDNLMHSELARVKENLVDAILDTEMTVSNQQVASFLRQENLRLEAELDIYSDLANMGLAAEIVNHEFNQLFINVNNAIKNMEPYVRDASAKYWLRQIDMGFRSISDRQNQLSPMYRTYSLRKAKTNLYDFIEEIRKFTESELKRNSVDLKNEVPKSIEIILSKSKLFPAISNLINNAVYWVLNQDKKIIMFRYDESTRTLYIEDSGTGIIAANKERIFEPFVSFKPNGRGLGLTVAKKVIESQGHRLEIASDEEKTLSGACFKIIFSEDAIGE